jgi:hypothetical protein
MSAQVPRLARIFSDLARYKLWGFPIGFVGDGDRYEKRPYVKWKLFQTRAPTRAERDQAVANYPYAAGAAIPTGPATGLFVLDADCIDAIEYVELRGTPKTVMVRTKKGLHYYFTYPADLHVRNSTSSIYPGIDIRGLGGMIVAAGSLRPDGFVYHYEPGLALGKVAIASPPDWLLRWLEQEKRPRVPAQRNHPRDGTCGSLRSTTVPDFAQLAAGIPDGQRDYQLFRLACWLRHRGYTPEQALAVVLDAAGRCRPPFPESLAAAKVASAWRYAR